MPLNPYLRVALVGFSDFEQRTLGSVLRLAGTRGGGFAQVAEIAEADVIVANADAANVIAAVAAVAREADTVFVGQRRPAAALTFLRRPIDSSLVLRELDQLRRQHDARLALAANAAPKPGAAAAQDTPTPGIQTVSTQTTRAHTALVVDDSAIAARFLQRHLEQLGLQVELSSHSETALELLGRKPFGWVFLDVELGEDSALDGLALCQHIKRGAVHPPVVVMVSAHDSPLDRVRGTFAGCDHYVAKPVDLDELRLLVSPPPAKSLARGRRKAAAGAAG